MPVKGRDVEVVIALRLGILEVIGSSLPKRVSKLDGRLGILDRRIEVGHHAKVSRAIAHLGPTDMHVHRRRERMLWMNDRRKRIGRAKSLLGIVVVVHPRDVDRGAIKERRLHQDVAMPAAVGAFVANPIDPFKGLGMPKFGRKCFEFGDKERLQSLDQFTSGRGMDRLCVDSRH